MHPNHHLLETLFNALNRHDHEAMAACYAPDAHFRDIAFDLSGKAKIHDMWRMICSSDINVTDTILYADEVSGSATAVFHYTFGASKNPPQDGRPVDNPITSSLVFRDGLIASHKDDCDAEAWASMAIGGPAGFLAGRIRCLRSSKAEAKLAAFLKANPQSNGRLVTEKS